MPGGNTRTVLYYSPFPVTFRSAEGATLHDVDGHAYTDFLGEFSAGLYGHTHPVLQAAAKRALGNGVSLGGPNTDEVALAEAIQARFPSCELLRFCNSGTEANLMALATARAVTGREAIVVFEGGYHGGVLKFAKGGSPLNVPFKTLPAQYNDAAGVCDLIERNAAKIAAVIVEPMMGGAGAIPGDAEFLRALREECSLRDIALIFDEVMTSRIGAGGLQKVHGIRPDLTTFGKYLGGGFSFGAFGGARRWMERYDPRRPDAFAHAGTFNNNVASMAVGLAGLRDVYTPEAASRLTERGERFRSYLQSIAEARGADIQWTGTGSLLAIHFQRSPIKAPRDIDPAPDKRALFHLDMMARGYYFARRGFLTLSVALGDSDYAGFAQAFERFYDEYAGLLGRH
jgi:glutamate-1-semialdehyde 2,1-aminomutase